jgi:hypothetical protein
VLVFVLVLVALFVSEDVLLLAPGDFVFECAPICAGGSGLYWPTLAFGGQAPHLHSVGRPPTVPQAVYLDVV